MGYIITEGDFPRGDLPAGKVEAEMRRESFILSAPGFLPFGDDNSVELGYEELPRLLRMLTAIVVKRESA